MKQCLIYLPLIFISSLLDYIHIIYQIFNIFMTRIMKYDGEIVLHN